MGNRHHHLKPPSLRTIAVIFLRAGCLSFGGWSAMAVLLEEDIITKHALLTQADLDTSVAYAQLLPGATQIAIASSVGQRLRGSQGALTAAVGYVLPSLSLITIFAVIYFRFSNHASITHIISGVIPVLCGIILANGYRLARKHAGSRTLLWLMISGALVLQLMTHARTLLIIVLFGLIGLLSSYRVTQKEE